MSQLKVYKASAGSGKTFRLAIEYMKQALSSEVNYRHILGVTFTNKATAEMKSRIIGELYHLAKGEKSVYLDVLCRELDWPPVKVERQAKLVLKRILHDYSRFSISTIDSFFQRVIKAFNRELGINAAYNVELDEESILEEAADRLIQSVGDNPKLLEWLDAFASDKMREGKGWNLKKDILRLGNEIYNETFKSLNDNLYEKLNDRDFLRNYRDKLNKIIAVYENKLKSLGQEGQNILMLENLAPEDFKGKSRSPATAFQRINVPTNVPSATVISAANDISAWVSPTTKEPLKSKLTAVAEEKLMPKLREMLALINSGKRNYVSAKLIVSQLYTLGILVDLRQAVRELCREKGIILISDSGHLLKDVISDSETPFVYEKTGSVYHHFMIDEFQDTSGLQWNNFRPLIGNSLAENNLGMVVGDVKQAIYRWRSGDWRLLAGKLGESLPAFGLKNEVLNSNWRSGGRIIRFNNTVFSLAPQLLQQNFDAGLAEAGLTENPVRVTIPDVYADCVQKVSNPKVAEKGYVRIRFQEKDSKQADANQQLVLDELVDSIKKLQDKGIKASEIAILVRKKREAEIISDLFLEQKSLPENAAYNFNILSGESLFITNSVVIAFLVSVLTGFLNPEDQVVRAETNFLYYRKIYPRLKKLSKVPELADKTEIERRITETGQLTMETWMNAAVKKNPETTFEPEPDEQFEKLNAGENELFRYLDSKNFEELISGKPILEIIYGICERFNLFSLDDELAYLQAFVDQISVFERTHASDLTSFLNWWAESGEGFTIPVSKGIDAINVLTIHKSKGLEFAYVFVPFFDWDIQPQSSPEMAPLLWCKPEIEPFNEMELVPIRYKKEVGESVFSGEYFTEIFNTLIDNLNLMYVALTRAKAGLFIWALFTKNFSTVGDVLKTAIEKQDDIGSSGLDDTERVKFGPAYNSTDMLFELGEISFPEEKSTDNLMTDVRLSSFEFVDFRRYLAIRKNGENFFTHDDKRQSGKNKGKLIHEILSLVETSQDLDKALKRMVVEGKLSASEAESLKVELKELFTDPEIKSWFDGSYRVVNERNILTGATGIKRPDRIMIGKDGVVVVDYKSGDVELDKYKNQLQSYIRILKKCGFPDVSGYIWYTKTNKRVAV